MIPKEKVISIVSKYESIEKELSSGSLDPKIYVEKSKEYAELGGVIKFANEYLKYSDTKMDLENIIKGVVKFLKMSYKGRIFDGGKNQTQRLLPSCFFNYTIPSFQKIN